VTILDGGLPLPGIRKAVNVSGNNGVKVITSGSDALAMTLRFDQLNQFRRNENSDISVPTQLERNGVFKRRFTHPISGEQVILRSIIFQKQNLGSRFFLGETESGSVTIMPK
jgi:hypothetical protein